MIGHLLLNFDQKKSGDLMNKEIYVVPFFGNWAVKQAGKEYPVSTHNLKNDAIRIGQQLAKRNKSELIIIEQDNK
jgi:hypothetical protein